MNIAHLSKKLVTSTLAALSILVLESARGQEGVYNGFVWVSVDGETAEITGRPFGSLTGDVVIPSIVTDASGNNYSVTSIGAAAFGDCPSLTGVTIPDSVTNIGDEAFCACGLTSVTIPDSVTSIGDGAFEYCSSLASVTIPSSVTSIGDNAFSACTSLASVTIADSVTNIGDYAFEYCSSLTSITIPSSVTSIGDGAFEYCSSLASVMIANGVTSIGDNAFSACTSLASVIIADSITNIGNYAFEDCSSLTSITISGSVTSIGDYAFAQCSSLASVMIAKGVTSIGDNAFMSCTSLASVCFEGNAPTDGGDIFLDDPWLSAIYYVNGTIGWGATFSGVPTAPCTQCDFGALQVMIAPSNAVSAGAAWQVDGGAWKPSEAIVALSAGSYTVSFKTIPKWIAPANQMVTITNGETTRTAGVYTPLGKNQKPKYPTLTITSPKSGQNVSNHVFTVTGTAKDSAAVVSVYYQLNGASWTLAASTNAWANWTATVNLIPGGNTVNAYAVNFSGNASLTNSVSFKFIPSTTLVVQISGNGTVKPNDNGKLLAIGTNYTLTAVPDHNNLFSNWVASGSENFVSNNPVLKFNMQSNLVLEANFVTNVFLAAQGSYGGLFTPTNSAREQTNSGSFLFSVTSSGAVSGNLDLGGQNVTLSGKFDIGGAAEIVSKPVHGIPSLITTLQLDFAGQSVSGTVSNSAFTAELSGYQDAFSSSDKATEFEGQYTLVIPGTNNPTVGPFGTSYGTVKVDDLGNVTLAGSLADGTAISQSSVVSQDGYWPLYVSLYGGKGSLWGWNYFASYNITAPSGLSWINATNSSKTAVYRSGFTNQQATLTGWSYLPGQTLPPGLAVTLQDSNFTIIITNLSENTNKLMLKTNKTTGVISGSFANPENPKQTIKINGVILQGQTNAQGYFLGTNQSGTFTLDPQ
jgi:hypothetical protein